MQTFMFADGSVREFYDVNRDKFLNPGFDHPNRLSRKLQYGHTWVTVVAEVELPRGAVFTGMFLHATCPKLLHSSKSNV